MRRNAGSFLRRGATLFPDCDGPGVAFADKSRQVSSAERSIGTLECGIGGSRGRFQATFLTGNRGIPSVFALRQGAKKIVEDLLEAGRVPHARARDVANDPGGGLQELELDEEGGLPVVTRRFHGRRPGQMPRGNRALGGMSLQRPHEAGGRGFLDRRKYDRSLDKPLDKPFVSLSQGLIKVTEITGAGDAELGTGRKPGYCCGDSVIPDERFTLRVGRREAPDNA